LGNGSQIGQQGITDISSRYLYKIQEAIKRRQIQAVKEERGNKDECIAKKGRSYSAARATYLTGRSTWVTSKEAPLGRVQP